MKKGFTLIELLVVVLIIGILAAAALPLYQKTVFKMNALEPLPILRRLIQEQKAYFMANGAYTSDVTNLGFTKEELKWKNWTYDVRNSRFQISSKEYHYLQWIYYFGDENIYCQVSSGLAANSKYRKLCESFGSPKKTCIYESGYDCYAVR